LPASIAIQSVVRLPADAAQRLLSTLAPCVFLCETMLRPRGALTCGLLLWATGATGRRLTGKFLHITDFHPDPFYKTYSSTTADAACHRRHGPAGVYGAETSGCDAPFALINQTFQWIDENIKDDVDFVIWTGDSARHDNDEDIPRTQRQVIQQNEFMVAKFAEVFGHRHHHHDRPVDDFVIPIVPTFGNNDIMPHNIFLGGPNRWTTKYLDIWRSFIPEVQRHQFQQGGWFSVDVIPGKLAVISLNTMYFFSSNSGVDGCASKREPGYEHMEWLRIQLESLRERGMKAIVMGHVPPARVDGKASWDETCWQKYTLWARQFRDVLVGSLYGHMNIDHFMLQDFEHITKDARKGRMASGGAASKFEEDVAFLEDGEVTAASASDYLINLRKVWAQLPVPPARSKKLLLHAKSTTGGEDDEEEETSLRRWLVSTLSRGTKGDSDTKNRKRDYLDKIGGRYAERYAVSHVAPSVVPNYFPTLRIIEYNISGLEGLHVSTAQTSQPPFYSSKQLPVMDAAFSDDDAYSREIATVLKHKKKHKQKKGAKKYKFRVPEGPSQSAPPGPAYSPQPLTWTRYLQYFANLTHINNDFVKLQHEPPCASCTCSDDTAPCTCSDDTAPCTCSDDTAPCTCSNDKAPRTIFGLQLASNGRLEQNRWKEGKHGKHQGKKPRPSPHPNPFVFEVEYDTQEDKGFKDLTVRRWVEYARKIGQAGRKHALQRCDDDGDGEAIEDEHVPSEGDAGAHPHPHPQGSQDASRAWLTFVKRAFVGTLDPHQIKALFSVAETRQGQHQHQEGMEL